MTELRKKIHELIATNKTEEAIRLLRSEVVEYGGPKAESQVTLLAARYKKMKDNAARGILSNDEISRQNAQIDNDILNILDLLGEETTASVPQGSATSTTASGTTGGGLNIRALGIGGAIILVILAIAVWSQMSPTPATGTKTQPTPPEEQVRNNDPTTPVDLPIEEEKKPLPPRKFRITAERMEMLSVVEGSTATPEGEIYGFVKMGYRKKGGNEESRDLFNRNRDSYFSAAAKKAFPISNANLELEVPPLNDQYPLDQYEFFLSADLKERDDGGFIDPDDPVGSGVVTKSLKDLDNNKSVPLLLNVGNNNDSGVFQIKATITEITE